MNNEIKEKKKIDYQLAIFVLQISACVCVLAVAVVLRFFGGELYLKAEKIFEKEYSQKTQVSEVLEQKEEKTESKQSVASVIENNFDDVSVSAEINVKPAVVRTQKNALSWPITGEITSNFGERKNPFSLGKETHKGLDISANIGTEVKSVMGGTVTEARYSDTYGYLVKIKHSDNFETLYAHCDKLLVKNGEKVNPQQTVALSGNTGQSTGPHLHFETIVNGNYANPLMFLAEN